MSEREGGPDGREPGEPTWSTYEPGGQKGETPAPPPPYGPASSTVRSEALTTPTATRRKSRAGLVGAAVGVVVLAAVGIGSVAAFKGSSPFSAPQVLTESGYDDLVAEIEDETGRTEVFQAVIYPEYASLDLPVDATSQRKETFRYDGDLDSIDFKGRSDSGRVDLAEIDPKVFLDLIPRAKKLVEDPDSWYVIIERPEAPDGAWFRVYASNEYSESASITADRTGKVLDKYVSE